MDRRHFLRTHAPVARFRRRTDDDRFSPSGSGSRTRANGCNGLAWPRFCWSWRRAFSAACAWFWPMAQLGIFHAIIAQLFFVLTVRDCAVHQPVVDGTGTADLQHSAKSNATRQCRVGYRRPLRRLVLSTTILIFVPIDPRRDDAATARRPGHSRFPARLRKNLAGHQRRRRCKVTTRIA